MGQEIFGPCSPYSSWRTWPRRRRSSARPKPLALYLFTEDRTLRDRIVRSVSFGGCINDTVMHLATSNRGFGGVGESCMGS
ncbi:MAG: hypothetical protein ACLTQI_03895 [Slackia sp.]